MVSGNVSYPGIPYEDYEGVTLVYTPEGDAVLGHLSTTTKRVTTAAPVTTTTTVPTTMPGRPNTPSQLCEIKSDSSKLTSICIGVINLYGECDLFRYFLIIPTGNINY